MIPSPNRNICETNRCIRNAQDEAYMECLKRDSEVLCEEDRETAMNEERCNEIQEGMCYEDMQMAELREIQRKKQEALNSLPSEPSCASNCSNCACICLKLPDGRCINRRFNRSNTVGTILLFGDSEMDEKIDNY